jgi:SDR family mycofactocin-dependent oxidoreductase
LEQFMGRVEGKVAFITGAARGQGRSHAVRLAEEGADIIAIDICNDVATVPYPMATKDDLDETARMVRATGRNIVAAVADVRDYAALEDVVKAGVAEFGRLDIVCANAGVVALSVTEEDPVAVFRESIDINLNGVWNTVRVSLPAILDGGRGGSVVLISSTAGYKGLGVDRQGSMEAYTASKHGVVGLMRSFANSYAAESIRFNCIHPTGVTSPMNDNDQSRAAHAKHGAQVAKTLEHLLPVQRVEVSDISNALLYLVSDETRYVTGISLPVDCGVSVR